MARRAAAEGQVTPIVWDTVKREDLAPREGRIRDENIYLTSALLSWMESVWGGVLTHVRTSTNPQTGEVLVGRTRSGEPGAIAIRRTGALNTAEFSFWAPLHKLGLKVPPSRQLHVTPFTREVAGEGTLFVFPMNQRVSAPRHRRGEKAAAEAAEQMAADAAPAVE